jgi:predicted aspartyl protease
MTVSRINDNSLHIGKRSKHLPHWFTKWSCLYYLYFYCLIISVIYPSYLSGQNIDFNRNLLGTADKIIIPYSYHQGFIIVDVVFQRLLPLKFILDTGAEHTIILKREYADALNLKSSKRIRIYGSDMSKELYALIYRNTFLQMANTQMVRHDVIVLEEDLLLLEEYVGTNVDGILGAEFFKGLILQIDYKKQQIILYNPSLFDYTKISGHHKLDLEISAGKPYLMCTTEIVEGTAIQTRLLVDTGAALTVLFHNNTDSLLIIPELIVKGNLGKGLGGEIEGFTGKVHRLLIDGLEFRNMLSSFQDLDDILIEESKVKRNGIIGNLLLERFNVVFDFHKLNLYLKPGKNYNKAFKFDKSGLTVFAFGKELNQYYVKYVMDDSPANEAGILPGDIIRKVGFWSTRWFSLSSLNKKLMGKTGKKITLTLERDGQQLKKEIILRDLFERK